MDKFQGIGVSPGFAEGTVYYLDQGRLKIPKYWIHDAEVKEELKRYSDALNLSKKQLGRLIKKVSLHRKEHVLILEGHLAMLDDPLLTEETPKIIEKEKINAEWALSKTFEKIKEAFSKIDEEYFRERQADISQVIQRVQGNLLGKTEEALLKIDRPVILVAHDLSPVDLAHMPRKKIKGIATDVGGRTSHAGIVAASMEIPAIVGVEHLSWNVKTGDHLLLDGVHGEIFVNPSAEMIKTFREKKNHYDIAQKNLIQERDLPSETEDHRKIALTANMELIEEIPFILSQGAKGVGLFRSEFYFLHTNEPPNEDQQIQYYGKILEEFSPHEVTIRTYDLGGEKTFPHTFHSPNEKELNPALGLRAIRYCLKEKNLFRTQLRALLRASVKGKLNIMFPMISDLKELLTAKEIVEQIKKDLKKEKHSFNSSIKIGVMIETPAAVMISEPLAKICDFFSVGTNDLIQYTLAVDRVNEHVAYLYNPLHPAILQMLKKISNVGKNQKIPVHLCGEMASDPIFLPVLVALGFTSLSLNAIALPQVKHILRHLNQKDCQTMLEQVESYQHGDEALRYLKKEMCKRFPEYLN